MDIAFVGLAFMAGLLTFLAPCTLPLVPGYLGFISGVPKEELESADEAVRSAAKRKIFKNGIFFILGFSIVFIVFGTLAGLAGTALVPFRIWLTRIGGALVILFGLFMMGVFKIPALSVEHKLKLPKWLKLGEPSSSLVVGGAFAFGWTPCVGPILGSILALTITTSTALQGALLLAVFSLGLAVPFILISFAFSRATEYINKLTKYLRWVSIIGGVFLVLLGLLLLFDRFDLTIQYGYQLLDGIGYSRLLDHL